MQTLESIVQQAAERVKQESPVIRKGYLDLDQVPEMAGKMSRLAQYPAYKGRIVPEVEAGESGRSYGLDPTKPQPVSVESACYGGSMVLNFADYTDEEVKHARSLVHQQGLTDPAQVGRVVCEVLAAMRQRRVKEKVSAYAGESAKSKLSRELPTPASTRREATTTNQVLRELEQRAVQTPPAAVERKPLVRVVVELPGGGGEHSAVYADVIVQDQVLVLVHDHSRTDVQHVWFPKVPDRLLFGTEDSDQDLRAGILVFRGDVLVAAYRVFPTNVVFRHGNMEYAILTISSEVETQQPEQEQSEGW
jgi:hypothetical protein